MDIRAAEISKVIRDQIASFGTEAQVSEVGTVLSVGAPAGIITHTERGGVSWETRSSSELAGSAPVSSAMAWTCSARGSQETTS